MSERDDEPRQPEVPETPGSSEPPTRPYGFDPDTGEPEFPGGERETDVMPVVQPQAPLYDPQTGEYLGDKSEYPTQPGIAEQPTGPMPAAPPTLPRAPEPPTRPMDPSEYPTQPPEQS